MKEVAVRMNDVGRSYGSGDRLVRVLNQLDLTVPCGELTALYGPSGSGKTTLLNLIGALDRPDTGTIEVFGEDIVGMSDGARARLRRTQIGFVFQADTLIPIYTALENIDVALRLPRVGLIERRQRAQTALDWVGLSAWMNHVPDELSGGQRQRVAIARALALRPALILADEPTSGVDTTTARALLTLFRSIAESLHTTFMIVSHDPMIAELVDSVYDMHDGQVFRRGISI